MNKALPWVLVTVIVLAVLWLALRPPRDDAAPASGPAPAAPADPVARLQAQAQRLHPGLPPSDALKKMSDQQAERIIAAQADPRARARAAAKMFYGFYYLNTEGRGTYCTRRGVALTPFVDAFRAAHRAELERAEAIMQAEGVDPAVALLPQLEGAMATMVARDMIDFANGANIPVDGACAFFNQNAAGIANHLQQTEAVRAALMATP